MQDAVKKQLDLGNIVLLSNLGERTRPVTLLRDAVVAVKVAALVEAEGRGA